MNIKKNDLINAARTIQSQTLEKKRAQEGPPPINRESVTTGDSDLSSIGMKSRVLGLQQEVKELQTEASNRQMQIAFLEKLDDNGNWQSELKKFMNDNVRQDRFSSALTLSEYLEAQSKELQSISNNILQKEVQMQNILSVSLLESGAQPNIVKEVSNSDNLFNNLDATSIKKLVNS